MSAIDNFFVYYNESIKQNTLYQICLENDNEDLIIFSSVYSHDRQKSFSAFIIIFSKQKIKDSILYTETARPVVLTELISPPRIYSQHSKKYNMICNYHSNRIDDSLIQELQQYAIEIYYRKLYNDNLNL